MMSLVSGKRHLLVQDISSAVASLGEACELLAQEFGDKAPECAEAYFYYGKALLEAARLEAGVLGNIDTDESEERSEVDANAEPEKEKEEIAGDGKETQDAAEQEVEDE